MTYLLTLYALVAAAIFALAGVIYLAFATVWFAVLAGQRIRHGRL